MDFDFGALFSSFLIGTIGLGFFMFGKKSGAPLPLAIGAAMMVYPYFITGLLAMWAIALVLSIMPFVPTIMNRHGA